MRPGDRSKEARRFSPSLKLILKSPKFRCSTAPKSAHLHRGREQGGGWGLTQSKRVLSEKLRFFGIIYQKKGGFIRKTGIFLTISGKKGGGLGQSKKSLSEKTEVVKKGGGGGSQFFD